MHKDNIRNQQNEQNQECQDTALSTEQGENPTSTLSRSRADETQLCNPSTASEPIDSQSYDLPVPQKSAKPVETKDSQTESSPAKGFKPTSIETPSAEFGMLGGDVGETGRNSSLDLPPSIALPSGPGTSREEADQELRTTRLDSMDKTNDEHENYAPVPTIDFKGSENNVEKSSMSGRRVQGAFASGRQPSARIYPVLSDSFTSNPVHQGEGNTARINNALAKRYDGAIESGRKLSSAVVETGRRRSSAYSTLTKTLTLKTLQVTARSSMSNLTEMRQDLPDPAKHRVMFLRVQKELGDIFVKPTESHWKRRVNQFLFFWIILNTAIMAFETCDGPNLNSADPVFPQLPTKAGYRALDAMFTIVFSIELVSRIVLNKFSKRILKHPLTWMDFVALSPWFTQLIAESAGYSFDLDAGSGIGHRFALVRLIRVLRLGHILRHYEQSKILITSVKASLPPLAIILFFLFTLVMVLATALFYAEPCYNVNTCTFTDIFNSAYFIMLTVATVGYGSQVPSLKNAGALFITCIAMILGQIYFSMPVAIIGNNFERTYESFQMNKRQKMRFFDASLSPFDCLDIHAKAKRLCDIQYHMLHAWQVIQRNIAQSRFVGRAMSMGISSEDMVVSQRAHHAKIMEAIERILEVHTESCQILKSFIPHKKKVRRPTTETQSHNLLKDMYTRARKVIANAKFPNHKYSTGMDTRLLSQTIKGRIWLLIEVPDSSFAAITVNKVMVAFALMSIMLFYLESLPELAASGVETSACRKVVREYCSSQGFKVLDPGCYLRNLDGSSDFDQPLDFGCSTTTQATNCYGAGLNFGSLNESALACDDAFFEDGATVICYRQQCHPTSTTITDMTPYWIYFEWYFGSVFTFELILRFYISQDRRHFLKDFYIAFDILAIVPFIVEVLQVISGGATPEYAIVASSPSFLSVIRVLKIMRILKLTRHFRATKVIASTAKRVWERLLVPLFFLFAGAIITGAIFYEIERGTECFVGTECVWWHKSLLTPWLSEGFPDGKRVLIQDRRLTIITDMIHSTWLSYTTLTSVGYGDLVPRTSFGKAFGIIVIIIATIYSAMPLSLVGTQFYTLYEKYLEKTVIKRGGSSHSWRTKRSLIGDSDYVNKRLQTDADGVGTLLKAQDFRLTDDELDVIHQYEAVKRTIANLQRNLENVMHVSLDIRQQQTASDKSTREKVGGRSTEILEQVIETKCNAVMDMLLQFSLVIERLHDAPIGYEAFLEDEHSLGTIASSHGHSPRGVSQFAPAHHD